MAVNVGDRTLSKIEVLYRATKLNEALSDLSLRSFGVRSRNSILRRKYEQAAHLDGDQERIDEIIEQKRKLIESLGDEITNLLMGANAIYPKSKAEYDLRITYQDQALAACNMVKSELNKIARMFEVDINCFENSIKGLDYEIHLIKEWRKSDRTRFKGRLLH